MAARPPRANAGIAATVGLSDAPVTRSLTRQFEDPGTPDDDSTVRGATPGDVRPGGEPSPARRPFSGSGDVPCRPNAAMRRNLSTGVVFSALRSPPQQFHL